MNNTLRNAFNLASSDTLNEAKIIFINDKTKAFLLFEECAKLLNQDALFACFYCLYFGVGCVKDRSQTEKVLQKIFNSKRHSKYISSAALGVKTELVFAENRTHYITHSEHGRYSPPNSRLAINYTDNQNRFEKQLEEQFVLFLKGN